MCGDPLFEEYNEFITVQGDYWHVRCAAIVVCGGERPTPPLDGSDEVLRIDEGI